ncbi:MAG: PD40 domain-containing protein [Aridibacter famidurans]|nr:PD40 domain-containing protein [Aridibacter famidurans]
MGLRTNTELFQRFVNRETSFSLRRLQAAAALLPAVLFAFAGPAETYSQTSEFRLGITYASSLRSNKEQFEFSIGRERVVLNSSNPKVYFNARFARGQSYQVIQISGPRTCNFSGQNQGVFAGQDILLLVSCGTPATSLSKLEVSGIEPGEVFNFSDEHGRGPAQIRFNTTINWGAFPQGDDYAIVQTGGPRQCRMTNAQGVVPASPLTVKADCGKTPSTTPGELPPQTEPPPVRTFKGIELVSRSSDDKIIASFWESFTPVIGGIGADEGRYVAFVTYTVGLGGSGKYRQVVWRDRKTGETRLVSVGTNGVEGNQNSHNPAISADGRSVAFESYATNLVPVDSNNVRDVFVWNADTNTVSAVSENRGTEANSESFEPSISADGNLIAFSSSAGNLAPGVDGTSTVNVYLRDMRSGQVTLISKDEKTGKGGGGSNPSISEDGRRIAFYNYFPLTKEDQNNLWDIYVWDAGNPKLKRVSKTEAGGDKDQGEESSSRVVAPSISGNGKYVAFATTATNMVAGDTNGLQDVFVVEVDTGRLVRASAGDEYLQGDGDSPFGQGERIAISRDGSWVAFSTKAKNLGGNILMKNILTGQIIKVSADVDSSVGQPSMSRSGSYVLFGSNRNLDSRFQSTGIFAASTDF